MGKGGRGGRAIKAMESRAEALSLRGQRKKTGAEYSLSPRISHIYFWSCRQRKASKVEGAARFFCPPSPLRPPRRTFFQNSFASLYRSYHIISYGRLDINQSLSAG